MFINAELFNRTWSFTVKSEKLAASLRLEAYGLKL
jgi:hypothetical protein